MAQLCPAHGGTARHGLPSFCCPIAVRTQICSLQHHGSLPATAYMGLCHLVYPPYCMRQPWLCCQSTPTATLVIACSAMVRTAVPCMLHCAELCHAMLCCTLPCILSCAMLCHVTLCKMQCHAALCHACHTVLSCAALPGPSHPLLECGSCGGAVPWAGASRGARWLPVPGHV